MGKKDKNEELNFLYLDDEEEKKGKKKKKKGVEKKTTPQKRKSKKKKEDEYDDDIFNFDNEIVIGVSKDSTNKKQNGKAPKIKEKKVKKSNNPNKKSNKKANIKKGQAVKWIILVILIIAAGVLFLMSPVFNIKEIVVFNNEKISSDTIVSLSSIKMDDNMFRFSSFATSKKIKEHAYVENVEIKRKLPNTIEIYVTERKATFELEYGNSNVYINNQGYFLEFSEEKLNVPKIIGISTTIEEVKVGSRLNDDDLTKLQIVLKIMEVANSNGLGQYITGIDITSLQDFVLLLDGENKKVYIGNGNNLNDRMRYLKVILEKEKDHAGEIFVDGDLNKDKVYFRESV